MYSVFWLVENSLPGPAVALDGPECFVTPHLELRAIGPNHVT